MAWPTAVLALCLIGFAAGLRAGPIEAAEPGAPLEQTCIRAGMKPMNIKAATMHGVHRQNGNGWYGRVRGQLDAMPEECAENGYYRVLNQRVILQNGLHRKRWSMIFPWSGSRWNGHRNNRGFVTTTAGYGVGPGFDNGPYMHDHHWTKWAYVCAPGPPKTKVLYQEKHTVIHTTGNIGEYGDRVNGPIQVLAGPTDLTRRIKVYGAC